MVYCHSKKKDLEEAKLGEANANAHQSEQQDE